MGIEVTVKEEDSCVSGYAKVNGKNRRVFQIYHSQEGKPDLTFAVAYANALKKCIEETPYEINGNK